MWTCAILNIITHNSQNKIKSTITEQHRTVIGLLRSYKLFAFEIKVDFFYHHHYSMFLDEIKKLHDRIASNKDTLSTTSTSTT